MLSWSFFPILASTFSQNCWKRPCKGAKRSAHSKQVTTRLQGTDKIVGHETQITRIHTKWYIPKPNNLMLHTDQSVIGHGPFGSKEEYCQTLTILRVFTIYGHGGHFGQVTQNKKNYLMNTPCENWVKPEKKMFRYVCGSPKWVTLVLIQWFYFGHFTALYGSHSQSKNDHYFPNFMYFSTYFPNFYYKNSQMFRKR